MRDYGAAPGRTPAAAVVGEFTVSRICRQRSRHRVPAGSWRRAGSAGRVHAAAAARRARSPSPRSAFRSCSSSIFASPMRFATCPSRTLVLTAAARHRARRRMGAADGRVGRPVLRRRAWARASSAPGCCAMGIGDPARRGDPHADARGDRAGAAAADARSVGRLHDRRARCADLHRRRDADAAGAAVRYRYGEQAPDGRACSSRQASGASRCR